MTYATENARGGRAARLPDLISDVVRLAADDLEVCLADPDTYEFDRRVWHMVVRPGGPWRGQCLVSLAGAVMAQTLGVPPDVTADLGRFPAHDRVRLERLNKIGGGHWREVLVRMDGKRWDAMDDDARLLLKADIAEAMRGRNEIRLPQDARNVADALAKRGF